MLLDEFDLSGYSPSHPVFTGMGWEEIEELRSRNRKKMRKMKYECNGEQIDSIFCVRAKSLKK